LLEAQEDDHAAARRCFARALDADNRNVPSITAWTQMEEELGNYEDARAIFERALAKFAPGCEAKKQLWRSYEMMEQRIGNVAAAKQVFQRSMRETMEREGETLEKDNMDLQKAITTEAPTPRKKRREEEEVEVSRWDGSTSMGGSGEIWMNEGSIESKMPRHRLNSKKKLNKEQEKRSR